MTHRGTSFELIIISNGVENVLKNLFSHFPKDVNNIKAFSFSKRVSQSVCVRAALNETKSEILLLIGSYQQITENSFLDILNAFTPNVDLACPWRQKRVDPGFNQLQSRVFNRILSLTTGSKLHDLSCTVRILRREVLENISLYGNLYRFLPILAQQKGYRVLEVPCEHFQERGKTGFYSFSDYVGRLLDIATLYFNTRFSRKPLRFFSTIGTGLMLTGLFIFLLAIYNKLFNNISLGDSIELLTAIILMVTGVETAGLGLLGEIIAFTHGRQKKEYTIEKSI